MAVPFCGMAILAMVILAMVIHGLEARATIHHRYLIQRMGLFDKEPNH